jgi:hypothetical protein
MAVSPESLLRLLSDGRRNGLPLIPYYWHDPARQPWQLALSARILAEVDGEAADVIVPARHSRRAC